MKGMKKLASLVLALVMVLSLTTTSFAAMEGTLTGGSITINDAVPGQTYNAYQILYLESYNPESGAYAYKANSAWEAWLAAQTEYVTIDTQGYVTWVKGADEAADAAAAAAFAKLAQQQLAGKTADGTATAPAAADGKEYSSVTLDNLKLGYYLVDTTLGTLCSLDTTKPTVVMYEKNEKPTVDKQVQEDSTQEWGESNTAQVGDTVNFKTTVHAKKGAQGYVLHDKMTDGLTLVEDSIKVTVNETVLEEDKDYAVLTNVTHDFEGEDNDYICDFEIHFSQAYLDTIIGDTDILVTYSAILNDQAVISTEANVNDTKLDYGEESKYETEWDTTETYTFKFDLVKTDSDKKVLTGAKFELYDAEEDGNKIALVKEEDGSYRIATEKETKATDFESAVIEAGQVVVKGLDANTTYWLKEIEAPEGYNKLAARVKVEIKDENLTANVLDGVYKNGGVCVENKAGTVLPSTGGMGTTIFYVVGGILVLAAVVLLVTRKRMSVER